MNDEYFEKQMSVNVSFEDDLLKLKDKIDILNYANELYGALCNMRWQRIDDEESVYSCTWRFAGGMIAKIRDVDESYLDFYCNGNEGVVSKRIKEDMKKLGWEPLEWDFDII